MITIMKSVVASSVFLSITALIAVAAAGARMTASAVMLTVPGPKYDPPSCHHTESQPCTSCSRAGMMDVECKTGGDFQLCSYDYYTCQNGAQCDQHQASGTCP